MSRKQDQRAERFAREYIQDFNGARAAIAVGYSEKTARAAGSRMLTKVIVRDRLAELAKAKMESLDVSTERILLELARIAFRDVRKLFDLEGNLKSIKDLDDDSAAAISSIDHDELFQYFGEGQRKKIGTTTKVKMSDKVKALELLGKYRTLFTEKVEHVFPEKPMDCSRLSDEDLETVAKILESAYGPAGGEDTGNDCS